MTAGRPGSSSPLLACLRWDDRGDACLRSLSAGQWDELWNILKAGGGFPFLARRLEQTGVVPPRAVRERLRLNILRTAARNLGARTDLLGAIEASGVPCLMLKGADLSLRVYRNLGMRTMGDIDVLVRDKDIPRFLEAYRQKGYTCSPEFHRRLLDIPELNDVTLHPSRPNGVPVELHWRLTDAMDDHGIDHEDLWQRSRPADAAAPLARVMAPEDLVLHLALHMKEHGFLVPLRHLWDFAELLSDPEFVLDWPALWARAETWRATLGLRIALYLLERTLGVPTNAYSAWAPDARLEALLPDLLPNLGRFPKTEALVGAKLLRLMSSTASWPDRMQALVDGLFPRPAALHAEFEMAGGGMISDGTLYLRRWGRRLGPRLRGISALFRDKDGLRAECERIVALSHYLDTH